MQAAESRIPELAAKAGYRAYRTTLKETGGVTVKTSTGEVVVRSPDGAYTVIMNLPRGKRVTPGTILRRVKPDPSPTGIA